MTDLSKVKRYRISYRDGVVEDGGKRIHSADYSAPMVLASDFDLALAKIAALEKALAERERDAKRYRWLRKQGLMIFDKPNEAPNSSKLDSFIDAALKEHSV